LDVRSTAATGADDFDRSRREFEMPTNRRSVFSGVQDELLIDAGRTHDGDDARRAAPVRSVESVAVLFMVAGGEGGV